MVIHKVRATKTPSCTRLLKNNKSKHQEKPWDWVALVNCMGEIRMDNFGYLNITFHFYFYFKTNLQKNLWRVYSYSWTSSLPLYQPVHFSLYHPFTPELSYFMDNLYLEFKEQPGRDETSCYETNLLWKANNLELLTNKLGSHRLLEYLLKCLQKDSEGFQ